MSSVILTSAQIAVDRAGVLSASIPPAELSALNVLTQVRQTMNPLDLVELAESILAQGQHAPGVVVALTPDEAERYVAEINEWCGGRHNINWLTRTNLDGVEYYLIVVAGHRRLRACQMAAKLLHEGTHTSERFTGHYLCEIHFGLTIEQALAIQFHENRHQQVLIYEEVAAAWRTWRFLTKRNPRLTITAFAKVIGRTASWVRSMLRFCELPESVQQLIEPNGHSSRVSYQLLVQVQRLLEVEQKHGRHFTELEVHAMVVRLVVGRVSPKAFAKIVSARIRDLEEGQGDLLLGVSDTRSSRRIALPHVVQGAHAIVGYWQLLEKLLSTGAFGDSSPFAPLTDARERGEYSPGSPIRLLVKITDTMVELLPHLTALAIRERRGRRKLEQALKGLETSRAVLSVLRVMEEGSETR